MRILAATLAALLIGMACSENRTAGTPNSDGGDAPASSDRARADVAPPDLAPTPDRAPQETAPDSSPDSPPSVADAAPDRPSDRTAAPDSAALACGTAACASNQICVQDCNCPGAPLCTEKGDAATCPGGLCPGDPTRCGPFCPPPTPRCVDLPSACTGTATVECLRGALCPGDLVQGPRLLCDCPP
jgi:hypothetical protein